MDIHDFWSDNGIDALLFRTLNITADDFDDADESCHTIEDISGAKLVILWDDHSFEEGQFQKLHRYARTTVEHPHFRVAFTFCFEDEDEEIILHGDDFEHLVTNFTGDFVEFLAWLSRSADSHNDRRWADDALIAYRAAA